MARPKGPDSTSRNFRIPDEVWDAAKSRSEQENRPLTDVVVRALTRYGKPKEKS